MIKPGIYDDMSMVEYHADDALGHGYAVTLVDDCPARFRWDRDHPQPEKREFDIGRAVHTLILEPEKYAESVVILPPHLTDYRKKEAQDIRDMAYMQDQTPLLHHQHEECLAMAHAVRKHPVAGPLLTGGIAEQSFFWRDEAFGVTRKCRPDYYRKVMRSDPVEFQAGHLVVNLKTAASAHPAAISKAAWDHGWHTSQEWTMSGLEAHAIRVSDYLYVVVEKEPPHLVAVYRLPTRMVQMAMQINRKAVHLFAQCQKSGVWPDYGSRIIELEPPRWVEHNFEEARVRGDYSLPEIVG